MLKEHIEKARILETIVDEFKTYEQRLAPETRIEDMLRRHGCPEQRLSAIQLCVEEALVNAIKHGNKGNPDALALVQSSVYQLHEPTVLEICEKAGTPIAPIQQWGSHLVHVIVCDEGQGDFRLEKIPDPTAPENMEKPGGRGIKILIAAFSHLMQLNERTPWPDDPGRSGGQIEMVFGFEGPSSEAPQKE